MTQSRTSLANHTQPCAHIISSFQVRMPQKHLRMSVIRMKPVPYSPACWSATLINPAVCVYHIASLISQYPSRAFTSTLCRTSNSSTAPNSRQAPLQLCTPQSSRDPSMSSLLPAILRPADRNSRAQHDVLCSPCTSRCILRVALLLYRLSMIPKEFGYTAS